MVTQVFERDDDADGRPHPIFTDDDSFERGAALEGLKLRVSSRCFKGGRITAVASGVTLDLREAILSPEGATIHVQSALSGIDIFVPREWDVVCDVKAVCGGIDAGRPPTGSAGQRPKLCIRGTVVVGGLCVR
jgi:cell wall-active antibiotic response 4TMS protein YvqF